MTARTTSPAAFVMLMFTLAATVPAQEKRASEIMVSRQTLPDRARIETEAKALTTHVPDLSWLGRGQVGGALDAAHLRTGKVTGQWTPTAVVVSQSPAPGANVRWGNQVDYTVGQPELSLTVDNATPRANESANFTLSFQPPLRQAAMGAEVIDRGSIPAYVFVWNDGSQPQFQDKSVAAHAFRQPGEYGVDGVARAMGRRLNSGKLAITVGFQEVVLRPDNSSPQAGIAVGFTAQAGPEAAPGVSVEYCFHWADDSPDACGNSSSVRHVYAGPRLFQPTVSVSVNRAAMVLSRPVQIQVQPAPVSARLFGSRRLGANQPGVFRIELIPPPAATDKVSYCFRWEENAPLVCQDSLEAAHTFDVMGRHVVSAEVTVNGRTTPAGSLAVDVFAYGVSLNPKTLRIEKGKTATLRAQLKPRPPAGSKVEYCFRWHDGTPDPCQTANSAVHVYSFRGTYYPSIDVRIDGEPSASSDPVKIDVVLPLSTVIMLIAAALFGTLVAGFGVHKIGKRLKPQVTAHAGKADHRISNPASLSKGPVLRIRCVCPPASVTLIAPRPIVKKKKEASHV